MNITELNINEIFPYEKNPREHDENQIEQICKSIKEFGFTVPILIDEQNQILAGHGRYMASKKLLLEKVPTIKLYNLTEAQKKAYIITDNQLTINSNWDFNLLKNELLELEQAKFNIDVLGFEDAEINSLFKTIEEVGELDEFEEFNEKIETEHECPKCGFKWSGNAN